MSADKIASLIPELQDRCVRFLAECARQGILLKVTHGTRSYQEQAAIYAKGRTAPGEPCRHAGVIYLAGTCPRHPHGATVTAAGPGWSWHNHGRAFDVAQQGPDPYPDSEDFWDKIGALGESLGLSWGGRWKSPDRPHFELTEGMTIAQARAQHDQEEEAKA